MATASEVISIARHEVGYRETRTNHTKYADQVAALEWAQDMAWCSTFMAWVFQRANARGIAPVTASCLTGAAWFAHQKAFDRTPRLGALVYYGPHGGTHVELVTQVTKDQIRTIGGNTSGSMDGNYFNGDGVYEKWVDRAANRIYGYGHPDYDPEKPMLKYGSKGEAVKEWQRALNKHGYKSTVNGLFDTLTLKATKEFQKDKKIDVDGIVGPITWGKVD